MLFIELLRGKPLLEIDVIVYMVSCILRGVRMLILILFVGVICLFLDFCKEWYF